MPFARVGDGEWDGMGSEEEGGGLLQESLSQSVLNEVLPGGNADQAQDFIRVPVLVVQSVLLHLSNARYH